MELQGRRALVTGASRGIGAGVVRALAREGACVVLTGRDVQRLQGVAAQIAHAGGRSRVHAAELRDPAQREELAQAAGPMDILVNNAGLLGECVGLQETSLASFQRVMEVNVEAVFDMCRLLVPGMLGRGYGVVLNVTSSVGVQGRAGWGAYAVSKFAVEGISQTLAADVEGSGVSVIAVNPGGTRTDMRAAAVRGEDPSTLPTPDEVAAVFVELAKAQGGAHNGERVNARAWLAARKAS